MACCSSFTSGGIAAPDELSRTVVVEALLSVIAPALEIHQNKLRLTFS